MALSRQQTKRKVGRLFLSAENILPVPVSMRLHLLLGVALIYTFIFLILAERRMTLLLDSDSEVSPDEGERIISETLFEDCNNDWSDVLWSGGTRVDTKSNPLLQRIEICVAYCHTDLEWIREAIANDFPQEVEIRVTIMSKCRNEADIVDFGGLSNVKVEVIKLPNKGGCDLAYAHFISRYLTRESSLQASASASSTALLFLKDTAANWYDGRLRSLNELVRFAGINGPLGN